jgi:heptosyltransferase-2
MSNWFAGCRRLLVRSPNWLGDVVMSLPALEAIRRATPAARLDLALPGHLAELFSSVPGVDGTLPLQRGAAALPALARQWSAGRFDSVLLLPNSFGSALAARLAGIPRRAGYATQGRSWLLTEAIPCGGRQRGLHQAEYYAELVADLGAPPSGLDLKRPVHLPVPEAARRRVEDLLAAERRRPQAPLYVLAPCAAGPAKSSSPERRPSLPPSPPSPPVPARLVPRLST